MTSDYERVMRDNGAATANGLALGLLAGVAIGAALGFLFAPRPGRELRQRLSRRATELSDAASKGYREAASTAASTASNLADQGRRMYETAREGAGQAASEVKRAADQIEPT